LGGGGGKGLTNRRGGPPRGPPPLFKPLGGKGNPISGVVCPTTLWCPRGGPQGCFWPQKKGGGKRKSYNNRGGEAPYTHGGKKQGGRGH